MTKTHVGHATARVSMRVFHSVIVIVLALGSASSSSGVGLYWNDGGGIHRPENGWVVGVCHALTSNDTRYEFRRRRRLQPAAANISSTKDAGSGTVALDEDPLPAVAPKLARHVL